MPPLSKPLVVVLLAMCAAASCLAAADEPKEKTTPVTTADPRIPLDELDIMAAPLMVEELKVEADSWLRLVKGAAEKVAEAKLRVKHQNRKRDAAEEKAEAVAETRDQQEAPARIEKAEAKEDQAEAQAEQAPARIEKAEAKEDQAEAQAEQAAKKKEETLDELTALRAERTALIDRLNVILERINQKIGLDENGKEKEDVLVYRRYADAVGGIKLDVSDVETAVASITGWLTSHEGGLRWGKNIAKLVAIIFVFVLVARVLRRATRKALDVGGSQSVLLNQFLVNLVGRLVLIVGIIVGLSALEVNIGPLLAVIGAAGFVVAFALQSTLSNFAAGVMLMFYRPFDVDDVVEVAGISGKVKSLNLVSTTLTTFDNKRMVVPNSDIWGNIITNATGSTERRVDMVFGIGYEDDIGHAKRVLEDIVEAHPLALKEPAPVIQLHELGDSSVNFICRPWAKTGDYWTLYWDVTRSVKERFDAEGISIPFPQRDVHVYEEKKALAKPDSQDDHRDTTRGADQMGLEEADSGDR